MADIVVPFFRYTTDDVSDTTPTWVTVAREDVRSFSTSRGRENELADVDAGTAQIVLDNRSREFDPAFNSGIRPMNRWWLQAIYPGGTADMFFGYAEAYQQEWPGTGGRDAVCVVHLVDEFKVLALDALPVMSPPRNTYKEVIEFDNPQGYWRGDLMPNRLSHAPTIGGVEMGHYVGTWTRVASPIIGDYGDLPQTITQPKLLAFSTTGYTATSNSDTLLPGGMENNGPGDAEGLSSFTFETWFKTTEATPGATRLIVTGPSAQYGIQQLTDGTLIAHATNSGATEFIAEGATSLTANVWYHIAIVVNGTNTLLYINGVQDGSDSWSGVVGNAAADSFLQLGTTTAVGGTRSYDDWAFYRDDLSTARLLAHYEAGALRGFGVQDPGARIEDVLTAAGSTAPTNIRAGSREMTPTFMRGQSPLEEIRRAELADNVDAVFFIAKDGTITFLDDGHRSVSPWNTVQATFDDDGTDLPYLNVTVDYSESFLNNEVNVNRQIGPLVTDDDAASIADFFKRTLSLGELPITTDADVTSVAAALLAKYKDPMTRVTGLSLTTGHAGIAAAVFPREIGDRIRVLRTPPHGGGSRIDQTVFIQKITVSGSAQSPYWNITLNVSPL